MEKEAKEKYDKLAAMQTDMDKKSKEEKENYQVELKKSQDDLKAKSDQIEADKKANLALI